MALKINSQISKLADNLTRKHVKNWKPDIRWVNGYMYRNITIKTSGNKSVVSVNVPWAKELDDRNGLFKNGQTLKQRTTEDWGNE
jgi:hypothetical protein